MSKEICPMCAGSGEGMFLTSTDPNCGNYIFAGCWACHGSGFKSSRLIRVNSDSTRAATENAVRVILREIEKRTA